MTLAGGMRLAQVAAAVLAAVLAWRSKPHRPLAALLAWGILSDLAQRDVLAPSLAALRVHNHDALGLLTGPARIVGHAAQGFFLSWPAGVGAAAIHVFAGRRSWLAAVLWAGAMTVLVLGYTHGVRLDAVQDVYLAVYFLTFTLSVGAILGWARRRQPVASQHVAALLLTVSQIAQARGLAGSPWTRWDLARVAVLVLSLSLVALFGGALWTFKSRSVSG